VIVLLDVSAALVIAARGVGRDALEDVDEEGAERG